MRYSPRRTYKWSKQMAYVVGLMASDGCLQSDGRHLDITSIDIEQLINFKTGLGRDLPISEKSNASKVTAYRIQFSDVAFFDFLTGIGLTPKKSKTIGVLKIPDSYYTHFLRGLFDGDGSCYGYFDPRWPTSFVYYVSITSARTKFLQFISETNQRIIKVSGKSIRRNGRAKNLVYGKADALLLYKEMYNDADALFLRRKKLKLESFINTDKNAIISRIARVAESVDAPD